jgi:hypothetical protein
MNILKLVKRFYRFYRYMMTCTKKEDLTPAFENQVMRFYQSFTPEFEAEKKMIHDILQSTACAMISKTAHHASILEECDAVFERIHAKNPIFPVEYLRTKFYSQKMKSPDFHISIHCPCALKPGTLVCSACRVERYCCRACQVDNWPFHKVHCRQIVASRLV